MRAVKVNRTLYPKSGYLSDSYQFSPKSALFRLRYEAKSQAAYRPDGFRRKTKFFRRKKFFCDYRQNLKKARLYPLVCLALRRISRPRKTIDHAIALSREDVPLSARLTQVPRRASRPHKPIDPAIALSREEWCRFAPFGLRDIINT